MLTPKELKPHILHEDRWIRGAALDYFTNSWSLDPEIAGLALTAHERYFKLGEFPWLSGLGHLPIDAGTVRRILALLAATPSRAVRTHLNWCLAALPLETLRREGSRIDEHPQLDEETRQKIRDRRRLGGLSDEELWEEFLEFSGRAKLRRTPHRIDLPRIGALVDELASRTSPDGKTICSSLRSPAFRGTFFEALLVNLAGVKRLKAAVPCLVAMLEPEDEDPHASFHQEALGRIGDPDTVRLIRKHWWDLERKDAASILGYIQTQASEEALVELYEEDDDPDVQFFIAQALCHLFSRRAVEPVIAVLREDTGYDDEELRGDLLAVIDLLGIELPEAESWRKEREENLARDPSPETPCPEALEIHQKILGSLEKLDRAEEMREEAYQELGRQFAEPEGEEEDEERGGSTP